jgi:uncharacterized protein
MGDISNEPSMEDILASIKKIIADDSERKISPPRGARVVPMHDVVDLSDRTPKQAQLASESAIPENDEVVEMTAEIEEDDVLELNERAPDTMVDDVTDIVSPAATEASRTALSSLSRLVVKPAIEGTDTLEGMVREMLKPMLKEWLDTNLPEVVERVVAQEVARISGRSL